MSKLEQSLCGSNEKHHQEIFDTIMDCLNVSTQKPSGITLLQVEVHGVINMEGIDNMGAEGPLAPTLFTLVYYEHINMYTI